MQGFAVSGWGLADDSLVGHKSRRLCRFVLPTDTVGVNRQCFNLTVVLYSVTVDQILVCVHYRVHTVLYTSLARTSLLRSQLCPESSQALLHPSPPGLPPSLQHSHDVRRLHYTSSPPFPLPSTFSHPFHLSNSSIPLFNPPLPHYSQSHSSSPFPRFASSTTTLCPSFRPLFLHSRLFCSYSQCRSHRCRRSCPRKPLSRRSPHSSTRLRFRSLLRPTGWSLGSRFSFKRRPQTSCPRTAVACRTRLYRRRRDWNRVDNGDRRS